MKQIIKINVSEWNNDEITFKIGDTIIAQIFKGSDKNDGYYIAEMLRCLHHYGCRQHLKTIMLEAVDFVKDSIEAHFDLFGIGVEFINEK